MAKRKVDIPACDVCKRSILPDEGGVEVREVVVRIDADSLTGDLCDDHIAPIREAAETANLRPLIPQRRRRSFDDSIVSGPEAIPKDTGDDG